MLSEEQSAAPASSCSDPALRLGPGASTSWAGGCGCCFPLCRHNKYWGWARIYLWDAQIEPGHWHAATHDGTAKGSVPTSQAAHLHAGPAWSLLQTQRSQACLPLFTSPPVPLTWTPRPPHAPAQAVLRTPLAPVSGTCPSEIHTLAWHQYLAPTSFTPVPTSSWCPGLKVCRTPSDPNSYCPSSYWHWDPTGSSSWHPFHSLTHTRVMPGAGTLSFCTHTHGRVSWENI